ncbi:WXG100 family type VII secretion target [Luteimicrobium sp. DT211]|uniref:WXG100 family type VII secretion target n=1 Tax=Luteimicrobium sp. DT211 TaxID=3393412 RepID=UPI003CEA816C
MSRFEVDSAEVAHAARVVQDTGDAVRGQVAAMLHRLEGLQGTWHGEAAARFAAVVDDWRAVQARVDDSLGGIQVAMTATAQTYADAEAGAAALFGR